mgnify:CR=1 FL=1
MAQNILVVIMQTKFPLFDKTTLTVSTSPAKETVLWFLTGVKKCPVTVYVNHIDFKHSNIHVDFVYGEKFTSSSQK